MLNSSVQTEWVTPWQDGVSAFRVAGLYEYFLPDLYGVGKSVSPVVGRVDWPLPAQRIEDRLSVLPTRLETCASLPVRG